jgi:hypothetical protein
MSVTTSDVTTFAPELAAAPGSLVAQWLDVCGRQISTEAYGSRSDDALLFLVCHYVTLDTRARSGMSGPASAVSSQTAGKLSKSFALASSTSIGDDMLRSTVYGQMFLRIRQVTFAGRVV